MIGGPIKSWSERLLEFAISIMATALLLNWAWAVIRPVVPAIMVVGGGVVVARLVWWRRHQEW